MGGDVVRKVVRRLVGMQVVRRRVVNVRGGAVWVRSERIKGVRRRAREPPAHCASLKLGEESSVSLGKLISASGEERSVSVRELSNGRSVVVSSGRSVAVSSGRSVVRGRRGVRGWSVVRG